MSKGLNIGVFVGLIVGVVVCLIVITVRDLSSTEALLLSLILTLLSMIASWLASRHYSELSFNASQRMFGLKAAEKVGNLSKELNRLALYLSPPEEDEDALRAVIAQEMRIDAAVHIIHTLRSVNDGSLSDWQSVIGDEISAARQEQEEAQNKLIAAAERFEKLVALQPEPFGLAERAETIHKVQRQLRNYLAHSAGIPSSVPRSKKPPKQQVVHQCLHCGEPLKYRQRELRGSHKLVVCAKCNEQMVSKWDGDKFVLVERAAVPASVHCPTCHEPFTVPVDSLPGGAGSTATCPSCGAQVRVVRGPDGSARARELTVASDPQPDRELVAAVHERLPDQPWPEGIDKRIAADLKVSRSHVRDAISELIDQGVFKLQHRGKLYSQVTNPMPGLSHHPPHEAKQAQGDVPE